MESDLKHQWLSLKVTSLIEGTLTPAASTSVVINDSKKTFVSMNGQEVFRFAVRKVPECIEELISKMKIEKSEIDLFLLHQANKRILESIGKRLKVSMDLIPENVSEYGNTSSASIPILLDEMVRDGKIQKGNKIIMAGFGAGLTWSAVYLEV